MRADGAEHLAVQSKKRSSGGEWKLEIVRRSRREYLLTPRDGRGVRLIWEMSASISRMNVNNIEGVRSYAGRRPGGEAEVVVGMNTP